jgi:hypothetical protein
MAFFSRATPSGFLKGFLNDEIIQYQTSEGNFVAFLKLFETLELIQ